MTTATLPTPATTEAQGPRIHDLPGGERPRERLLQYGPKVLSNAELIAILLRTGIEGASALGIAQQMLSKFEGLRGLADATLAEVSEVKGLSRAKYCQVAAGLELGRRLAALGTADRVVADRPEAIADLLSSEVAHLRQEHLYSVLLDIRNQVLGIRQVYVGTVNTAKVRACEVFRPAVRENATAMVVVHNHPSGDPTPSRSDVELTMQLIEAGEILNIQLLGPRHHRRPVPRQHEEPRPRLRPRHPLPNPPQRPLDVAGWGPVGATLMVASPLPLEARHRSLSAAVSPEGEQLKPFPLLGETERGHTPSGASEGRGRGSGAPTYMAPEAPATQGSPERERPFWGATPRGRRPGRSARAPMPPRACGRRPGAPSARRS